MAHHLPVPAFAWLLVRRLACAAALLAGLGAVPAGAQPFGAWMTFSGHPTHGYVQVPHHSSLNPSTAFTFEAWVAITNDSVLEDCRSIAGKNYLQSWWVGQCTVGGQPLLRSYLKGSASQRQGGIVQRGQWTHVAVTYDGSFRRHYINGELAASFAESGTLPGNASEMRIGSDVSWPRSPAGSIDEVRLWSVARSEAQIRAHLNQRITTAQPGLVAVWALDGNPNDIVGPRDGTVMGSGTGFLTFPVAFGCGTSTATSLCLDDRFLLTAAWRTNPTPGTPTDGSAKVVPYQETNSGLFWFFSDDNWEIMVKVLDGCSINDRYWMFSASATNVFYRLTVIDVPRGVQKIYFNYPGPPAPAVTDTTAFATCP